MGPQARRAGRLLMSREPSGVDRSDDHHDEPDRHEDDIEYQRSPAGQREAEEYWKLNNRRCGGSREPDPWPGRPHPRWYYRYL